MALPDTIKLITGTQVVFANTGEYSPTAGQPSRTDQIDLGALADTNFRQSTEADLTANRSASYLLTAYLEFHSSPTAGGAVNFYIGYSETTGSTNNPANLSGTDGAYQGYGADVASAQEAVSQLEFVGSLIVTADTDIFIADVGVVQAAGRYAMIVVENATGTTLAATDAIETAVALTPIEQQIQD